MIHKHKFVQQNVYFFQHFIAMDGFTEENIQQWKDDTLETIAFLQFQLGKLQESDVPENKMAEKRMGHALQCLLRHYKCRTNQNPTHHLKNEKAQEEYFRLMNVERRKEEKLSTKDSQTQAEQEVQLFF